MNVLAIGAHFDDVELGCGGALARHVAKGDNVYAYVATRSGYVNPNKKVIRSDEIAHNEGVQAMAVLGAELICGQFRTLEIEFNDDLNMEIMRIIEEKDVDMVYTHWIGDIHHDHLAVARASLHACRHVPRMLMYRSNWYHSNLEFKGNFYIDITNYWKVKAGAVKKHSSELERVGNKWIAFFENEAKNAGQRIGVKYAEVFEVIKWLDN